MFSVQVKATSVLLINSFKRFTTGHWCAELGSWWFTDGVVRCFLSLKQCGAGADLLVYGDNYGVSEGGCGREYRRIAASKSSCTALLLSERKRS
jgi:hypothetical protein